LISSLRSSKHNGNKKLLVDETRAVLADFLGLPQLHYLESCVDCQACAEACPFVKAVSKVYSPYNKANGMRRLYRGTSTLMGRLFPWLFDAKLPSTEDEVSKLYDLAYNCTNCGWCYYTCPHGIDSGALINMLRGVLFLYNRVPEYLKELVIKEKELIESYNKSFDLKDFWEDFTDKLERQHRISNFEEAEYMILLDLYSASVTPEIVDNYLTLLDASEIRYAIPDRPLGIRPPLSHIVANKELAIKTDTFIFNYVKSKGIDNLLIIDGGYQYNDLRFVSASYYQIKKPRKLDVVHVLQVLWDNYIDTGKPVFVKWGRAGYIPSCNIDTRGGVGQGAKLVEETAQNFDKHLKWPYAGPGWLAILCPEIREKLSDVLNLKRAKEISKLEEKLIEHIRQIGVVLSQQAQLVTGGYHVFSCHEDIHIVNTATEAERLNAIHIAQWLVKHLLTNI